MSESPRGLEQKESGEKRLEALKQTARESYKAADALEWDSKGLNSEKSQFIEEANDAVDEIAKIEGIEPGEVTYEYLGMETPPNSA